MMATETGYGFTMRAIFTGLLALILSSCSLPFDSAGPLRSVEGAGLGEVDLYQLPDRSGLIIQDLKDWKLWTFEGDPKVILSSGFTDEIYTTAAVDNNWLAVANRDNQLFQIDYETLNVTERNIEGFGTARNVEPIFGGAALLHNQTGFVYWSASTGDTTIHLDSSQPLGDALPFHMQSSPQGHLLLSEDTGSSTDGTHRDILTRWRLDLDNETATVEETVSADHQLDHWTIGRDDRVWGAGGAIPLLWEAGNELTQLPLPADVVRLNELPDDVLAVTYENDGSRYTEFVDRSDYELLRRVDNLDLDQPISIDEDTIAFVARRTVDGQTRGTIELWRIGDLTGRS